MNIDMLSASAHKFHGPKGVGFLYAGKGVRLTSLIEGGAQERGKRAGTENVSGIAAMAAALEKKKKKMAENAARCTDPRGAEYLARTLDEIGRAMGCENAAAGAAKLKEIFDGLGLEVPAATEEQFALLKTSVNPVRLKNHPIALDADTIDALYHQILNGAAV